MSVNNKDNVEDIYRDAQKNALRIILSPEEMERIKKEIKNILKNQIITMKIEGEGFSMKHGPTAKRSSERKLNSSRVNQLRRP